MYSIYIFRLTFFSFFFFFTDTATTEIYTLSLHDALPILVLTDTIPLPESKKSDKIIQLSIAPLFAEAILRVHSDRSVRSEEHTSELQSRPHLVCRLLLEKKKITYQFFNSLYCIKRTIAFD